MGYGKYVEICTTTGITMQIPCAIINVFNKNYIVCVVYIPLVAKGTVWEVKKSSILSERS